MSRFIWPVKGSVSQAFGGNAAYYKQYGQLGHNGTDIAAASGSPVYASADGTVIFEGWGRYTSGYAGWAGSPGGIWTLIDHGDVYTGYAHQLSTVVSAGQKVKQGQLIGYVGATGDASGPHTHFEFIGKQPNFANGYAGRLNPANYNVGQLEGVTMDRNAVVALYRVGLHREPENDDAINGRIGKSPAEVIDSFRASDEWLTQNHKVVFFDQYYNLAIESNRQLEELRKKLGDDEKARAKIDELTAKNNDLIKETEALKQNEAKAQETGNAFIQWLGGILSNITKK